MAAGSTSLAAYLNSTQSQGALQALRDVFAGLGFVVLVRILARSPGAGRVAVRLIGYCVVAGVALVLYDLTHPLKLGRFVGRGSGLYLNPNIAGAALVFGFIVSVGSVRSRWRAAFAVLTMIGVIATLSRGAMLACGVVVMIVLAYRMIRVRALVGSLLVAAILVASPLLLPSVREKVSALASSGIVRQLLRLNVTSSEVRGTDVSVQARLEVTEQSLALFRDHPLLGAGLAATSEWYLSESTHNMYLRFLAELGILGLLLYPAAAIAALWQPGRRWNGQQVAFLAFWLLWGLFSHNVLNERAGLLALALIGPIARFSDEADPDGDVA
jgi:O-antigen ligase